MMRHTLLSAVGALVLLASPMYAQTGASKFLPGTKSGVLSTISGKAVTATNGPVSGTLIRLRDVRFGQVVATTLTDKAGQFEFKAVDIGTYIAEMMNPSGEVVLASSSILYVGSGEVLSTLLKMPLSTPALGTVLGNSASSALSAVTTAAQALSAATTAGEPATMQNPTR
jgi:hypothetical protein